MRARVLIVCLAATLSTAELAAQSNAAQVEALLRRGVALRQRGDDLGAVGLKFLSLRDGAVVDADGVAALERGARHRFVQTLFVR